ncbi:hypothetical protein AB0C84_45200 [Actinomadura sp. NPDC048955]|uniref:hypothetical protein n=1 Tax=Actinomadura sp. NPDC048955 TaxID=3158228 RepID=UPI003403AB72
MKEQHDLIVDFDRKAVAPESDLLEAAGSQWVAKAQEQGKEVILVSFEVPDREKDIAVVVVDGRRWLLSLTDNDSVCATSHSHEVR